MTSPGFQAHDHARCVSDGMEAALSYCERNGLKFTPVRQRVFEILLSEHKAMGAYDILEILAKEGMGSQPPVVYRALDFLGTHGFVHKIEKLNAFVACDHPGLDHDPAFMICRSCTKVVEMDGSTSSEISSVAQNLGFEVEAVVVEAEGLCPTCQDPS